MATEKKSRSKSAKTPIRNSNMIGGNHPERGKDAILKKGRASYTNTMDNSLGTQHSKMNEAHKNSVKQIVPGELKSQFQEGKQPQKQEAPAKNSWVSSVRPQQKAAMNQPAKEAAQPAKETPQKTNGWVDRVSQIKATLIKEEPSKKQPVKEKQPKTQEPKSQARQPEKPKAEPAKAKQPEKPNTPTKGR